MIRLWNICAFIALANLVALIGLVVWLTTTGRIDSDRVDQVRALFAQPMEVERLAAEAERQAEELEREASLEEGSMVALPASSRPRGLLMRLLLPMPLSEAPCTP